MKLNFDDAYQLIDTDFLDGNCKLWFELVWNYAEEDGLTEFNTAIEKLNVYSLINGMYLIYTNFSNIMQESSESPDPLMLGTGDIVEKHCGEETKDFLYSEDLSDLGFSASEIIQSFLNEVIQSEESMDMTFNLIKRHMNVSMTFAYLYYALFYYDLSLSDYETDDYYYEDMSEEEIEDAQCYDDEIIDYERRKRYSDISDIDLILDEILNDSDIDKVRAFEWLNERM